MRCFLLPWRISFFIFFWCSAGRGSEKIHIFWPGILCESAPLGVGGNTIFYWETWTSRFQQLLFSFVFLLINPYFRIAVGSSTFPRLLFPSPSLREFLLCLQCLQVTKDSTSLVKLVKSFANRLDFYRRDLNIKFLSVVALDKLSVF